MREVDFLFESDTAGILLYENQAAVQNRLENWISTPRGTFWGRPDYGHTLRKFLHEPPTDSLAMLIESELVDTLAEDLPEINLQYVKVLPTEEFDGYYLRLGYSAEDFNGSVDLTIQS